MQRHQSYGQFTSEQVKEAMNMPWGGAQRYLESLKRGFCENCNKSFADIEAHKTNNKYCREFYQEKSKKEILKDFTQTITKKENEHD